MADANIVVKVPKASPKSYNPNRPVKESTLLRSQIRHLRALEVSLLKQLNSGIQYDDVKTEADAAAYIRRITGVLHPHLAIRRKK